MVADELTGITNPRERLVHAMVTSLRLVREDSVIAVWFTVGDAIVDNRLAQSSAVIEGLVAAFLGDGTDPAVRRRARWVVRVLVSLLADPEADVDHERVMVEEFVVPVVVDAG